MRFRLLRGVHSEGKNENGLPKVYNVGDVFESSSDLSKHNHPELPKRFERLPDDASSVKPSQVSVVASSLSAAVPTTGDGLDEMTVSELKAFAEREEIDLSAANRKAEVIDVLRSALATES